MDFDGEKASCGGDQLDPHDHVLPSFHTLSLSDVSQELLHINDLPNELLLYLFALFTPQQLCGLLAYVCSKWHRLCRDPSLWKTLEIATLSTVGGGEEFFSSVPLQQLRALTFTESETNVASLLSLLAAHCPSLTSLTLPPTETSAFNASISVSSSSLLTFANRCPNIKQLLMKYVGVGERKYDAFERFRRLEHLWLMVTVDSGSAHCFGGCERLRRLKLTIENAVSGADFSRFVTVNAARLTELIVKDSRYITAASYASLERCVNLRTLCLIRPRQFTDACLSVVGRLPTIARLSLCRPCPVTTAGLLALLSAKESKSTFLTPFCSRVESLMLLAMTAAVTDDVLAAVAENCPNLVQLDVHSCAQITDGGVSQVVEKCSKLIFLVLGGAANVRGSFLPMIPNDLPHLRELDVREGAVDEKSDALRQLRKAMPQLNVRI